MTNALRWNSLPAGDAVASLDDRDRHLLDAVRSYVDETVVPARDELDAVIDRDNFPISVVKPGIDLGLKSLAFAPEDGGRGASAVLLGLVVEELARGELGIAYYFKHNWRFSQLVRRLPPALRRHVTKQLKHDPWYLGASAITEANVGSDNHLLSSNPELGVQLKARRDGDHWVLNGEKVMITNATMAGIYFVGARTDAGVPAESGVTLIAVPGDTDGISFGPPYRKLGQRSSIQTDVHFDNCRVPLNYAVSEVGRGLSSTRTGANTGSNLVNAFMSIGVARAAYEVALDWCTSRVQGGSLIYEHQLVAHQLGSMRVELDAALGHAYCVARALDKVGPQDLDPAAAWAANVSASEMVVRVARAAMELLGGRGMMAGWGTEKLIRDALTLQHGFGTNPLMLANIGTLASEKVLARHRSDVT